MENINQLYLIGMMGSGKSSIGKSLSINIGWDLVDIDDEICSRYDTSINDLFMKGEENFREIEYIELQKHILKENTIIAVGGGAVTFQDSYDFLSSKHCIYLKTSKKVLIERLKGDNSRRLLNVDNKEDIISEIKVSKTYQPNEDNIDLLFQRYSIWKDLYNSNKKIAQNLSF